MKDDTKLFYDLMAEKTAHEWYENDILMPTMKDFVSLLPDKPRILDLGCGPGHETKRLASLGAEVVGIDYSLACIRVAQEKCPECVFLVMDFCDVNDSLGHFDGVVASASLIHVASDALPCVSTNVAGVVKKNGYCLVIVQDGEGMSEQWSTLEVDGKFLQRTVYCYTKDCLSAVLAQVGFEFIKEGYLDARLYEQNWRNYIFKKI